MFVASVAETARKTARGSAPRRIPERSPVRGAGIGNQAMIRLLMKPGGRIGTPVLGHSIASDERLPTRPGDDPLEAEAEAMEAAVTGSAQPASGQPSSVAGGDVPRPALRRTEAGAEADVGPVPAAVGETLDAPGSPLGPSARAFMAPRFGTDFARVVIHTDARAAASAREVGAEAYTVGNHIVFSAGRYAPGTEAGRALLAHELTHVVQQRGGGTVLQKAETFGTRVSDPPGTHSPYKTVTATFDGETFVLFGDGKPILQAAGQSGHPNQVEPAEATACRGGSNDSYLNNVRYVGIKDKGPIPEGTYQFRHASMVTFSALEDARMALAKPGEFVDPAGLGLHGDWGSARVALTPMSIKPSRFCGDTAARSGFYLHGGIMTGSSGCIDIGNSGITEVVEKLRGYTKPVTVIVKYTNTPPEVGVLGRAAGRFMYPAEKDAGVLDRLKSLVGL